MQDPGALPQAGMVRAFGAAVHGALRRAQLFVTFCIVIGSAPSGGSPDNPDVPDRYLFLVSVFFGKLGTLPYYFLTPFPSTTRFSGLQWA